MPTLHDPVYVRALDGRPTIPDAEVGILNRQVPLRGKHERTCPACHLVLAEHLVAGATCLDCAA